MKEAIKMLQVCAKSLELQKESDLNDIGTDIMIILYIVCKIKDSSIVSIARSQFINRGNILAQ